MTEQPDQPVFLICTVGGSPQPIATALRLLRPEVVWFLVSDGKSGESSRSQVECAEIDYDKKNDSRGPGLRFVDGCPAALEILEIPTDDPDGAYALCRRHLARARTAYPEHRWIADYTGGTKSMTGALLMGAFAEPGVEVQFMLGERPDLVQVRSGSERPQRMSADLIMAERDFAAAEQAVAGYEYGAANALFEANHKRVRQWRHTGAKSLEALESLCERLRNACVWTRIMASWDAFEHAPAAGMVPGAPEAWLRTALRSSGHLEPLLALGAREPGIPDWRLCADLWLNAQRRAERGRYDDAIARLYRLVEASAQAWLWSKHQLRSSRIPLKQLPEPMRDAVRSEADAHDEVKLGLNNVVRFLRYLDSGDRFAMSYAGEQFDADNLQSPPWLTQRNLSILAHGFESVSARVWKAAEEWTETRVRPFFRDAEFPQLPREIPPFHGIAV